jgi:stage V sporulation protein S
MSVQILKVSAVSNPNLVAGAIAANVKESGAVAIQAIGAAAINQAVKAVAITRGFVTPDGIDLICVPSFDSIIIDGETRTAIRLTIEPR